MEIWEMYGGSIKCLLRQSTALDGKRQSPRKIQPAHRSGLGFKAIKQNKNGPPFYNEGDESTGGEAAIGWALRQ